MIKDSKQKQEFNENNSKSQEHESLAKKVYQKSDSKISLP